MLTVMRYPPSGNPLPGPKGPAAKPPPASTTVRSCQRTPLSSRSTSTCRRVASGGVSALADLTALRDCGAPLNGAISGRALYDGALDLREALAALRA